MDEPVIDNPPSDESPYAIFVNDTADFRVVTKTLSDAGFRSYVFEEDVIDHMTISDELFKEYVDSSATIFYPFDFIANYSSTTSDHLPVRTRYAFSQETCMLTNEPEQQASELNVDVSKNSFTLKFTAGDGDGRVVVVRKWGRLNDNTLNIEDGITYSSGEGKFGEGSEIAQRAFVVYSGDEDSVTVTGLQAKAVYAVAVAEYNVAACDSSINYLVEGAPVKYIVTPGIVLPFKQFSAYPNPVKETLNITVNNEENKPVTVVILNKAGQKLFEKTYYDLSRGEINIPIENERLSPGLYFLKIRTGGESPQVLKFFKE